MAKADANKRQVNKIDVHNLSERDRDFLTLEVPDVMSRYKVEKQAVYDRRFALNKKLRQAGLSLESALNNGTSQASEPEKDEPVKEVAAKKAAPKKVKQAKAQTPKPEEPKAEENIQEPEPEVAKNDKASSVIMKPIEMKFENFSIKLNGIPKKIAVNPETNSIEIEF